MSGPPVRDDTREHVDATIAARRSVRQFLPTPLTSQDVLEILDVAARAPSGHNTQAWQVHVVMEGALQRLIADLRVALDGDADGTLHRPEFDSYPAQWVSPYVDRRRRVGKDMYTLLGIPRGDQAGMREQLLKNYAFFGAPVGLLFTLPRVMVPGSVLDLGMLMQSVMLAARARGLDTCAQAAFAPYHRVISLCLSLPDDQVVICGMALGHADPRAAVNRVVTHREPAASFAAVHR